MQEMKNVQVAQQKQSTGRRFPTKSPEGPGRGRPVKNLAAGTARDRTGDSSGQMKNVPRDDVHRRSKHGHC